jgi:putative ATP-dependent endonuclease of OLD family
LFEDVKAEISIVEADLADELRQYLPDVRGLNFSIGQFDLDRLVSVKDLTIDDGANTTLQQKGDGFKSLFSISLLQYLARRRYGRNLIFAIEEPEAHLHSSAIYEIKDTLRRLSDPFQVLITTHSPILIQRDDLGANIIVQRVDADDFSTTAQPARSLAELRRSLGVRPHENMATAEVAIVVEGLTEERTLPSLLSRCDPILKNALANGRVRVIGAGGGSNIPAVVRVLARDATNCVTLADSDNEGQAASQRLRTSGFMLPVDIFNVPARPGSLETEYEDLFDPGIYLDRLSEDVGLTLSSAEFQLLRVRSGNRNTRHAKWSDVMRSAAQTTGQDWEAISSSAKTSVAAAISSAADRGEIEPEPWARAIAARVVAYLQE